MRAHTESTVWSYAAYKSLCSFFDVCPFAWFYGHETPNIPSLPAVQTPVSLNPPLPLAALHHASPSMVVEPKGPLVCLVLLLHRAFECCPFSCGASSPHDATSA